MDGWDASAKVKPTKSKMGCVRDPGVSDHASTCIPKQIEYLGLLALTEWQ